MPRRDDSHCRRIHAYNRIGRHRFLIQTVAIPTRFAAVGKPSRHFQRVVPVVILGRFVFRWRIETTFQKVREHLNIETQRQ